MPLVGGFGCLELCLYDIMRELGWMPVWYVRSATGSISRVEFLSFVKIFCLLGTAWITDLISTALEVEQGYQVSDWSTLIG